MNLDGGVGYGDVTDLVFDQNGALSSVLIAPDASCGGSEFEGGIYAYPYCDDGTYYDPAEGIYTLPYAEDDVLGYSTYDAAWTDEDF